ncbi:MAG TPA: hypothetical protein DCR55_15040 [Lentisphaeria bacterium]|nr:hypothetical protein [Lentisphaeria bacterium]
MIKTTLKILFPIALLIGSFFFIRWMISNKPQPKTRPSWTVSPVVEVAELEAVSHTLSVRSEGNVRPRIETTLVTQIGGRIVELSDKLVDGAHFAEGDVLIRIEATDYEIAVQAAEATASQRARQLEEQQLLAKRAKIDIRIIAADVTQAQLALTQEQARAGQALRDWDRMGREGQPGDLVLRKPQLAAARAAVDAAQARQEQKTLDLELADARIATARAALAAAEAEFAKRRLDLTRTTVVAPYNGRVLEQLVDHGRYLGPGSALAQVYPTDAIEVRLSCSARDLAAMDLPAKPAVTLTSPGDGLRWQARIERSEGRMDTHTRQLVLIARVRSVREERPLQIGEYVEATIRGRTIHDVYVIPREAVRPGNEILLIDSENRLRRETINLCWSDAEAVITDSALPAGHRLVLTALSIASDGTTVQVKGEEPLRNKAKRRGKRKPGSRASSPHGGGHGRP